MRPLAVEVFGNLPTTTVTSGGTTAPAGGTQQTWTVQSSALFPAVSSSATPPTQIHVADISLNSEIISVINISGTTWTVIRGAEGTTPVAHSAGFTVYQVVTAGWLGSVPLPVYPVPPPAGVTATDTPAVTAVIDALNAAGGNGTLLFRDGTYQVDSNTLVIQSCSNFTVRSTGATVIAQAPNRVAVPDNTAGDLFVIADSTDFRVEGITLDAMRDTVAPLTPLTATASSGQPSVTVAAGQGGNYQPGQHLNVYGGLGASDQNTSDTGMVISSVTPGGGSGGGDLITFTGNLAHTYNQTSSTPFSDGYGPYAYAGDYLSPYQTGVTQTVAGRTLHGEDLQNGLHLLSCERFTVSRVTSRNLWESGIKCGTGFASTVLTDGCSEGAITDCITYHGYDQGISLWLSATISVTGCTSDAAGWGGIVLTNSDYCTVTANKALNSVYRVPNDTGSGTGIAIEGGRSNQVKGNIISGTYSDGMRLWTSPVQFGLTGSNNPTTSTFLAAQTAAGTSVQVSSTTHLSASGQYSILDGGRTEAVTAASIVDGTHVTFSEILQFSHASGVPLVSRVPQDNVVEGNTIYGPLNGNGILHQTAVRTQIRGNTIKYYGSGSTNRGLNFQSGTSGATNLPSGTALAGHGSVIQGNDIGGGASVTILATLSDTLTITGNRLWGASSGGSTVMDLQGLTNCTITGNTIANSGGAATSGIGIKLSASGSTNCARLTISGNMVSQTANEGIIALLGDSLTITGNVVTSCGGNAGINLRGVTRSLVQGNTCNSNKNAGIQLEDQSATACQFNAVTGNTARDDGTGVNVATGGSWTQQHGIVEKGTANSNLFTGNEADSNAVDQLTTVGAATYVAGNVISGTVTSPPVISVAATDTSVVVGGTATAPTLATGTLDVIAADHPAAADWSNNSHKITSLANGSAASDAMAFGQLPQAPGPAINGLIAWSQDMASCGNTTSRLATGGTLYLIMITLWTPATLSKIWWINIAAAVTPTSGQSQVGLYNSSGTLVASATAAATATAMVGSNAISVSLSAPYAAAAGNYWVGMVFQAGTEPGVLCSGTFNGNLVNLNLSGATLRYCVNGTGITTALPTPITTSSNTTSGSLPVWVGVS